MPDWDYLGGTIENETMQFLMQKPDGTLVFVGTSFDESSGWSLTESTPLPKGTIYGYENFSSSLFLPSGILASIGRFADGTWGINFINAIQPEASEVTMFHLGQNWICEMGTAFDIDACGTHPWSDVTTIDWQTLPATLAGAQAQLDRSFWAVVSNPKATDRLHLRTEPSRDARSLGKYYSGTPVRILAEQGDWVQVDILGVQGWMMRQYLAFGETMLQVKGALPELESDAFPLTIYRSASDEEPIRNEFGELGGFDMHVLGVAGDEWYHIWLTTSGLGGYVRQMDLSLGNG
ncbi:MAG: SH3 domain-containing protein [Eubacteriales bacterium]|nr:SH3 domain-containing protein [Eubacteriales bacterium]